MDLIGILWMIVIFVISLAIVLIIPKIRELENGTIKTIAYLGLGILMFTFVGFAFNVWETPATDGKLVAANIVNPYINFYPTLILALAITATVLITYLEKDNYAYYFAGAGFAVLLPDVFTYVVGNGRYDLVLLGGVLWMIIPVVWVFIWRGNMLLETSLWEKGMTSLKATFLTYPVYLLTSIVAIFGESPRGLDSGSISALNSSMMNIFMFILVTIWLYFLVNIIIVTAMFLVHDFVLHMTGYRRVTGTKSGIRYEKIKPAVAAGVEPPKPKVNHYEGLMQEMEVFSKHIDSVDRIRAASTIGRFKNEYLTLAAKYNEDSKADAEKMIKSIENQFMQKY